MKSDIEVIDVTKIKNKKILAIGAHPDDIEFGAGGTLVLLSKANSVSSLVVTDGRMGTHNDNGNSQELVRLRIEEARKAGRVLGASEVVFYGYPDTELSSYDKNLRRRLLKDFLRRRPDIIFSHDPWGRYEPLLHPDHRTVAWAVVENVLFGTLPLYLKKRGIATKPLNPKPQIWLYAPAEPNVAIDITDTLRNKFRALEEHTSQFDEVVVIDTVKKRVEDRAKMMGEKVGVKFAEVFRTLR